MHIVYLGSYSLLLSVDLSDMVLIIKLYKLIIMQLPRMHRNTIQNAISAPLRKPQSSIYIVVVYDNYKECFLQMNIEMWAVDTFVVAHARSARECN